MSRLLDRDLIAATCPGRFGENVAVFRETASTSDVVRQAAEKGAAEGFVAFAESQTQGRGQFGRRWASRAGLGLWFSVLLRPQWPASELAQMTPLVAVSVVQALRELSGLSILIKQPNDIMHAGRKMAGILCEARTGVDVFVVVGIGINVNHSAQDFPLELQTTATSFAQETGREWPREPVAAAVLSELDRTYEPARPPGVDVLEAYAELSRRGFCDSLRA